MKTIYQVYWDNGYSAAGTFSQTYDTEAEAQAAADAILAENIALDVWDDWASTEVIDKIVPDPEDDEGEEQSLDYFNRYIAGDR